MSYDYDEKERIEHEFNKTIIEKAKGNPKLKKFIENITKDCLLDRIDETIEKIKDAKR